MKHFSLLLLLFTVCQLPAQGWIWQAGNSTTSEELKLIWNDTDSTVVCVGDSAGLIVWKQFDHSGQLLIAKQVSTINQNPDIDHYIKHDFGFTFLTRTIQWTSWSTYNTSNYYQLNDPAGNTFYSGVIYGQNNNNYQVNDALLTPDSAALVVGTHINPDETKLYLQKTFINGQTGWIKELHDSTKNIKGWRICPVSGNRYLLLATRSGYIGSILHYEFGFLLLNETGDLLESNWVPTSGTFESSVDVQIPIVNNAEGFSVLKNESKTFYRFDAMGHFLWSKKIDISFTPLAMHPTNTGYVLCGNYSTGSGNNLLAIATIDQGGNLLWSRFHVIRELEHWYDVAALTEGGYIAVGALGNLVVDYNSDFFAAKINADGSIFNNKISGYVFADLNANCLRDSAEMGIANLITYFNNNYSKYTVQTDPDGHFDLLSDMGSYTLKFSQPPGAYWTPCVDSLSGYFPDAYTTDTVYFPFRPTILCPQMRVDLEANRIRPCSTAVVQLRWQNAGTALADSVAIILTLPANAELVSSQLPMQAIGSNQYLLDLGMVPVGGSGQIPITIEGDCALQIGDVLCLQAEIFPNTICTSPEPVDSTEFQFAQERCLDVRNSYDPNDKTAEPLGRGEFHYIPADTALVYLIRFQNTGNDTAFTVIIRDTLSADLDPFSVRPEIASHPYRLEFQENGSLKFIFDHILLPDSTANEAASHGFIRFQVKMRPGLLPLTTISNRAAIYFDYNSPVLTNTVQRTIEPPIVSGATLLLPIGPLVEISPNPGHGFFELRMQLAQAGDMQINVYDGLGQLVSKVLPGSHLSAGAYQWIIPAETWPVGMYFIEISSQHLTIVRKLIRQ